MSDLLQSEYKRLEDQQKRRLERLKELRKPEPNAAADSIEKDPSFGVSDDLQLLSAPVSLKAAASTAAASNSDSLPDQIRSLKDENGRLYKLVSEKDYEVRCLQKKLDSTSSSNPNNNNHADAAFLPALPPDAAASRIMELARRTRELTAELEAEKRKSTQLKQQNSQLEKEARRFKAAEGTGGSSFTINKEKLNAAETTAAPDSAEMRQIKATLKETEKKLAEIRCQNVNVTAELKKAMKALADEIGDPNVSLHEVLAGTSQWRGRQQQIIGLREKVKNLEKQLKQQQQQQEGRLGSSMLLQDMDTGSLMSFTGASSVGRETFRLFSGETIPKLSAAERNLATVQRQRAEKLEKCEEEVKQLAKENETMKGKLDAGRSRQTVLSGEVKTLKEQMKKLLEKGRHDDELITTLLKQQELLKTTLESTVTLKQKLESSSVQEVHKLVQEKDQENRMLQRFKEIIQEKESEIVHLKEALGQPNHQQHQEQPSRLVASDNASVKSVEKELKFLQEAFSQTSRPSTAAVGGGGGASSTTARRDEDTLEGLKRDALYRACEVERDKFRELVTVQDKRYEEMVEKNTSMDKEMQAMRRQWSACERLLQKHRLSLPSSVMQQNRSNSARNRHRLLMDDSDVDERFGALLNWDDTNPVVVSRDSLEQLQMALSEAVDEIKSLRWALKSALTSKKDDLNMLTEMVTETRAHFLNAVKQMKLQINT